MNKRAKTRRVSVCLLSAHPLVIEEFQHLLSKSAFQLQPQLLEMNWMLDLRTLHVPGASIYLLDTYGPRAGVEALIARVLEEHPSARLVAIEREFTNANSFSLLRLGAKGLLTFDQACEYLPRALKSVAAGGYWVPRSVLSSFVDSVLKNVGSPRPIRGPGRFSQREQQVLDALLQNLSNKEIADKLCISERTAKFHVSNLLAKFGVHRRADLILLSFQQGKVSSPTAP